jgi:hypothetical protein
LLEGLPPAHVILIVALRFVSPTQLVARIKESRED